MSLLSCKDIGISFGGLKAVDHFSIDINPQELVGLIGPNGAGKTTIFNMMTGVYLPTEGDIQVDGKSVVGKKPYDIVQMGAARTFQNIRLFRELTVIENVKIALHHEIKYGTFAGILRGKKYDNAEAKAQKEALELLKIFEMEEYAEQKAKNLPYGKQRKLEIARALATNPKILMLDEPAAGMNPQETQELMDTIHFIRDHFQISVLLIEHDMNLVMGICERLIVIDYGKIIAKGTPEEIRSNEQVIGAYLGS